MAKRFRKWLYKKLLSTFIKLRQGFYIFFCGEIIFKCLFKELDFVNKRILKRLIM